MVGGDIESAVLKVRAAGQVGRQKHVIMISVEEHIRTTAAAKAAFLRPKEGSAPLRFSLVPKTHRVHVQTPGHTDGKKGKRIDLRHGGSPLIISVIYYKNIAQKSG